MKLRMSRNPNSPYKTREDVTHSPLISGYSSFEGSAVDAQRRKPIPRSTTKFLECGNDLIWRSRDHRG